MHDDIHIDQFEVVKYFCAYYAPFYFKPYLYVFRPLK